MLRSAPFARKIQAMERAEIKQIGDYVKDMEEGLVEWEGDRDSLQVDMAELYQVIKRLMEATSKTSMGDG